VDALVELHVDGLVIAAQDPDAVMYATWNCIPRRPPSEHSEVSPSSAFHVQSPVQADDIVCALQVWCLANSSPKESVDAGMNAA